MARQRVDLTGQQFGKFTVLEYAGHMKNHAFWYCQCECGHLSLLAAYDLRRCKEDRGCKFCPKDSRLKHGGAQTGKRSAEYEAWLNLKHDPKQNNPYPSEWEDFQQFFKDVGWKPSPEHRLARHDNRIPHSKENTYWRDPNAEEPIITRPTAVVRLRPVRATGEATRERAGTTEQVPCQV